MKAIVTKTAPFFKAQAWNCANKSFSEIALTDFQSKYVALFFYPFDFTFVCPTEIISFNNAVESLKKLDCEVVGVSCDSKFTHKVYTETPKSEGGLGEISFPLLADFNKEISTDYGVLHDAGMPLRGTFIIDRNQVLRHASINAPEVGRNVDEFVRIVQACQFADEHGDVCPANWKPGAETMKPNWDAKETQDYFKNVHSKN